VKVRRKRAPASEASKEYEVLAEYEVPGGEAQYVLWDGIYQILCLQSDYEPVPADCWIDVTEDCTLETSDMGTVTLVRHSKALVLAPLGNGYRLRIVGIGGGDNLFVEGQHVKAGHLTAFIIEKKVSA
jgi:hypothetical protein